MARLPAGAFSVASRAAPLHSPPRPRPWAKRMSTRIAGATIAQPGVVPAGIRPMTTVAMPMVSSEATSVFLRPMRSPKWPKTIEPIGRATKATPKTANDCSSEIVGSALAKKIVGNTSTAAVA